jgi:hypothetical protein
MASWQDLAEPEDGVSWFTYFQQLTPPGAPRRPAVHRQHQQMGICLMAPGSLVRAIALRPNHV